MAIWVAFAEGRRWSEAAASATLAAEREGVVPWCGPLPVTPQGVRRVIRDKRYAAEFRLVLDEGWHVLVEPARNLLGKLVEEGMAETADDVTKARALVAAKEILKAAAPRPAAPGGRNVQVNVSGSGTSVSLGLGDLLAMREPFHPPALVAGPQVSSVDAEVGAAPTVDATQPRRSRTSSTRTREQRQRAREQGGG